MFHDIAHLQQLSSCVGTNSCGIGASGPLMFGTTPVRIHLSFCFRREPHCRLGADSLFLCLLAGGIQFDDTQVSASWLADSDNGATALDMTGSDQVRIPRGCTARASGARIGTTRTRTRPCQHLWTDVGLLKNLRAPTTPTRPCTPTGPTPPPWTTSAALTSPTAPSLAPPRLSPATSPTLTPTSMPPKCPKASVAGWCKDGLCCARVLIVSLTVSYGRINFALFLRWCHVAVKQPGLVHLGRCHTG